MEFVLDSSDNETKSFQDYTQYSEEHKDYSGKIEKSDLINAYRSISTPQYSVNPNKDRKKQIDPKRMSLSNFVDSPSTADDTEPFFLTPITLKALGDLDNVKDINVSKTKREDRYDGANNFRVESSNQGFNTGSLSSSDELDRILDDSISQTSINTSSFKKDMDSSRTRFRESITHILKETPIKVNDNSM